MWPVAVGTADERIERRLGDDKPGFSRFLEKLRYYYFALLINMLFYYSRNRNLLIQGYNKGFFYEQVLTS